jgi:hypothetical protein
MILGCPCTVIHDTGADHLEHILPFFDAIFRTQSILKIAKALVCERKPWFVTNELLFIA